MCTIMYPGIVYSYVPVLHSQNHAEIINAHMCKFGQT